MDSREALERIRGYANEMADPSRTPYLIGWDIWDTAFGAEGSDTDWDHCRGLWLIWGSLTDWVENKPDETAQAEDAMRRAAAEWLLVADDEAKWRLYLDRWIYDEMGYERPTDLA